VTAVADAHILAALCDMTVLVLRAEVSTRKITLQACDSLDGVDARMLGVIVNGVPHKASQYGYYGGYGYYSDHDNGNGHHKKRKIVEVNTPRWTDRTRPHTAHEGEDR
jgi:Mrp family chromosome partitioning ATPase